MKKLSNRVAALTPSITAGLILFAVALTALLAYRAFEASRAQRRMGEQTLREYAGFAAFQLKNAMSGRLMGQGRGAFFEIVRLIGTAGPLPPLGAERAAVLIRQMGPQCRCLNGVSFFYQVTFPDGAIDATASDVATPGNLQQIRDTVVAHALAARPPEPPLSNPAAGRPPGVPITSQVLVSIVSQLAGRPYVFTHALTVDTIGSPVVAYGYAAPAEFAVGRAVRSVLGGQPILPSTLVGDSNIDSILSVTVETPGRAFVFRSRELADTQYAATDTLDSRFGALRLQVAIAPEAAGRLIIGGLPQSRLPEVLATAFISVCLLGLLLYQFRRQEELGRLRDDFVSGVSHELRTPLAQIRLLAELLHMGKVPSEEQDRSLRIIDKEARRLSFLVDSILNFTHSRPDGLAPVSTDIAVEIDEIVAGFAPLADAEGVRLTTRLERGIVASVDRGALRQVVLNLLDNAVRYGPHGQTVTIITTATSGSWTLVVADEGPGIPADERERIFAPYYRMKRDSGGAVGGTGIGLAVVRRLVEEQGGRVQALPPDGEGATGARFVVSMPTDATGVRPS